MSFLIIFLREVVNWKSTRLSSRKFLALSLPHMRTARTPAQWQYTQWPPTTDGLKDGCNRISLLQVLWQSHRWAHIQITTSVLAHHRAAVHMASFWKVDLTFSAMEIQNVTARLFFWLNCYNDSRLRQTGKTDSDLLRLLKGDLFSFLFFFNQCTAPKKKSLT